MKEELNLEKEKIYQIIIGGGLAGLTAVRCLKDALILNQKKREIGFFIRCFGISVKFFDLQNIKLNPSFYCTESFWIKRILPNGKIICKKNNLLAGYVLVSWG